MSTWRGFWLKQIRQWHWVSSAMCLVGMLGFAVTGITLNHAAAIEASPVTRTASGRLPEAALALLKAAPASGTVPIPEDVALAIEASLGVDVRDRETEWSDDEVYVALPRPGGDAFLTIDRRRGALEHEVTERGWVSYLNDLHKGRNTGSAWGWFLDVFAVACVVFCVTGLFLLYVHAGHRPATWPMVGLGFVVPALIVVLLIH